MDSLTGESYCEVMALNVMQLSDRIQKARKAAAEEASRTFDYNDPTANKVVNDGAEIEKVTISVDGIDYDITWPERWVKTIKLAIKRYSERYGIKAGSTIVTRYVKGKEPTSVYVKQGISRRSFGDRREKFLKMLLLYAVQNKLLNVS